MLHRFGPVSLLLCLLSSFLTAQNVSESKYEASYNPMLWVSYNPKSDDIFNQTFTVITKKMISKNGFELMRGYGIGHLEHKSRRFPSDLRLSPRTIRRIPDKEWSRLTMVYQEMRAELASDGIRLGLVGTLGIGYAKYSGQLFETVTYYNDILDETEYDQRFKSSYDASGATYFASLGARLNLGGIVVELRKNYGPGHDQTIRYISFNLGYETSSLGISMIPPFLGIVAAIMMSQLTFDFGDSFSGAL
ncbi:MAG: hypothetical protein IIA59_05100 [Candidatus Marinimicrobia bacterium]|nr:hypothetical protein [Candidatus Neomarinimicrobiota bacterium]